MTAKISQEVTGNILEDLINARNMDDIVRELSENTGLDSKQAESFVTRLFVENKSRIALSQKILEDLTDARNMDDIVREVCEKTDLDWTRASSLVNRLAAENSDRIILSQSPLLVPLALFTFLSGAMLVIYDLYQFYQVYSADSKTFLFELLFLGMNGSWIFWSFLLGIAMIFGSLKGMEDVWEAIFERYWNNL
jgi:hypothetical protein